AHGDRIVDIRGAAVEPLDNMVDLTIHRRHGAARRLAAAVAGQDGPALGRGEQAFGPVLNEDVVVAIPDLTHEFTVAGLLFGMTGMEGPNADGFGDVLGPGRWWMAAGMRGVFAHGGVGFSGIGLARNWWEDAGGAGWSSSRFGQSSNPEGFVGGLNVLDDHQLR